jgi:hypothetical protein
VAGGVWSFVDKVLLWIDMGCEPTGTYWAGPSTISPLFFFFFFFSFSFFFLFSSLIRFSIALLKCVWHRLAARLMRLGDWKGVERLASPCRLKSIDCCIKTVHEVSLSLTKIVSYDIPFY